MKKLWLLIGLLVVLILTGITGRIALYSVPKPGVTEANYRRIEKGMPVEQVERLLGVAGEPMSPIYPYIRVWMADSMFILITFNPDGTVEDKVIGFDNEPEPPFDMKRRSLGL